MDVNKSSVESDGLVTVESDGLVTVESDGLVTVESDGLVTVESDGLVTVESDGLVTVESDGQVTAESDGLVTAESDGLVTVENDGLVTAESDGLVTAENDDRAAYFTGECHTLMIQLFLMSLQMYPTSPASILPVRVIHITGLIATSDDLGPGQCYRWTIKRHHYRSTTEIWHRWCIDQHGYPNHDLAFNNKKLGVSDVNLGATDCNIWATSVNFGATCGHWRVFDSDSPSVHYDNSHLIVPRGLKDTDRRIPMSNANLSSSQVIMPVAPVHPDGPALDPAVTAKPTPAPLIVKAEVTVRPAAQSPEEARVTNLKQWCKQQHPHKVPYDQVSKSKLASIIVDERHKLLFCQIPGVALNDWRKIILILNGAVNASSTGSISGGDVFGKYAKSVKRLSEYDDKKRAEMLQNYYKVVFVRDPLERLVNAYKVKLNAKASKYFHKAFGSPIIRKYRKNAKDKDIKDGSSVTFAEFTKYILDNEREGVINLNEHWQQYYKQCHPCLVDYDFVGTYEAVEKDTATVLDKVSAKNMLKPPFVWDSKPATQKELNSVYSQVSPQDLNSLYKIYSADYTLFGYECPEYLHTLLQKGNVFHDY
ncbi:Carbohydrate sulfotransferase 11 [Bulinus truncatus]|nr:Carbohydrate sulfotransferase 11 [Bulinus truncatus]